MTKKTNTKENNTEVKPKLNIYQKLLAIQSELKAPKEQYNAFGKYKYRNQEDILEAVKPLLVKYDCVLTVSDQIALIGDRHYLNAVAVLTDTITETTIVVDGIAREPLTKKGMDEAQITGATSSYARKYALNGLFSIDDTKDSDASHGDNNNAGNKKPSHAKKTPPAGKNTKPPTKQDETRRNLDIKHEFTSLYFWFRKKNFDIISIYMKKSDGTAPTLEQIKDWKTPKQIDWLASIIDKINKDNQASDLPATAKQIYKIQILAKERGLVNGKDKSKYREFIKAETGHDSAKDLSKVEASDFIEALTKYNAVEQEIPY